MDVAGQVAVLRVGLLRGPWGEYFEAEVLAREPKLDDETGGASKIGVKAH